MAVIALVKGTHTFKVMKKDGEKLRPCFWYAGGQKLDEFAKEPAPTVEILAKQWGRGEYRLACLGTDRKSLGMTKTYRIDDPALPDLGFYPNDPALAVAEPPSVAPPPPVAAPVDPSRPPPSVTQVPIDVFHYLYTLAQTSAAATIKQSQQMHALEVQRLEQAHALTMTQTTAFWSAQLKAVAESKAPDPAIAVLSSKLEDMEEQLEEGREEAEASKAMVPASLATSLSDPIVAGALQELPKLLPVALLKLKAWLATVQ